MLKAKMMIGAGKRTFLLCISLVFKRFQNIFNSEWFCKLSVLRLAIRSV